MIEVNYFDFQKLIEVSCNYCKVKQTDKLYPKIVYLCGQYFWRHIKRTEFQKELDFIKYRPQGVYSNVEQ